MIQTKSAGGIFVAGNISNASFETKNRQGKVANKQTVF